jgi:hypothetical protein
MVIFYIFTWVVMSFGVKNGGYLPKGSEFKDYFLKIEDFSR